MDLDEAIDRVIAGPQRRSRLMNEKEKLITAYHEGGHALVAAALPGTDPVQKVTILPRGRALGYTMVLPEQDKYANTRAELLDQLAYMMGGRAAEELVFHDPTTGASNDIEKATNVARAMVTQYGMTERLGAIKLGSDGSEPFLGRDFGHQRDYSEDIAAVVDQEVSKLISNAHQEAFDILNENRDVLDALVRALFERETLDRAAWPRCSSRCGCGPSARPGPAPTAGSPRASRRSRRRRPRSTARTVRTGIGQRPGTAASRSVEHPPAVLPYRPVTVRRAAARGRPVVNPVSAAAGSRRHRRTVRSVVRWSELAAGRTDPMTAGHRRARRRRAAG